MSPPTQGSREVLQELQSSGLGQSKGKLRLPKPGFSQKNPKRYRCDFCRKRGHLSRNCPAITFRVSLSEGAMVPKKAQEKIREEEDEEEDSKEPEVLVTTADPETLPDAAIRLVERRAVRASLKEEQDRLKQHEAEANEILRREKERRDRERRGQDHEVSEKEKKFLAKEAKKKNTKEKKNVLKDKGVVKAKKAVKSEAKEPEARKPEAKRPEAKKPVVEEEYSYYTSPSQEPEAKPAPKVEDGKRKEAAPKLVAKKQKAKPPTPPKSSSEPEDDEGEEEGLLTDDFPPEGEESTSPSQESEAFEAESAVPKRAVGTPKRTEVMPKKRPESLPDPKQKPPKRLIDDKAEMDRLREESRQLEQAQREVEAERAQLRAELKAKKAKKKAEEAAKQAEEVKKAAKEKEKEEKKELRRQAEADLRKEDEARVADRLKRQTGGKVASFYPQDPAERKKFIQDWNQRVADYQAELNRVHKEEQAREKGKEDRRPEVDRILKASGGQLETAV